ncbi:MAG: 3-hydroxyacyl-CoA dehydrogenase family protein [Elusimicrobia bacterium]|nr:3-hydroxyacyl-CoA dehydrogenase family protein [Elusimicrobiota bacterium]
MNYAERLKNVTVLGAAGKMGSGILLLTAMEMTDLASKPENKSRQFVLNAIDVSDQALGGLMKYLKVQVQKAAEKKIVPLRKVYEDHADLVDNKDIIDRYVADVIGIVRPSTRLESAYQSGLIFEAIIENPGLKVKLLSQINKNNAKSPWIFTNTSSIPIHEVDEKAGLGGRILGVHFYNPPAIQKLVELIRADSTQSELVDFALVFAKNLGKIVVPSNDFAGFIGNGHFMRDALHGISEAGRLSAEMSFAEAVYTVNRVTQDFLLRPMGIFQLIDYVGLDVCQYIMSVMNGRLGTPCGKVSPEVLHSPLLDRMISAGVRGGQRSDGSQKDGFFKYEKNRPAGIYDPDTKRYLPVSAFQAACDERMGPTPLPQLNWKSAVKHPKKEAALEDFFGKLAAMDTPGANLAKRYGERSREIGLKLVSDKVAQSEEDVNMVLLSGFYHVYGPINKYFKPVTSNQ